MTAVRGLGGLLIPVLVAPALAEAAEETGRVEGAVFVRGTTDPLVAAPVRVGAEEVRTDREGRFVLTLPPGRWPVSVQGPDGVWRAAADVVVAPDTTSEILVAWTSTTDRLASQVEAPEAAVAEEAPVEGPGGTLAGRVVSSEDGQPIAGARVYVRGRATEAITDADGRFALTLPAGPWELSVVASAFAAQGVPPTTVVADETRALTVELVPAGLALDDFTVRMPRVEGGTAALLDERQSSSHVADVIGAEQMTRSGDSSAASALRRVTGLTLVGGRYVYVRGLGERYSTTLLNGGMLPSPEPERRVVPLDMFPATLLDSVVVQKTFSPDMPAEFGGGVVQLRTRSFPSEPVYRATVSLGVRGRTSFHQGLVYSGGPGDFFGIDGGTRALPEEVAAASEQEPLTEEDRFSDVGYSPEELEDFAEQLPNVWSAQQRRLPPDLGLSFALGDGFEIAGRPAGALFGFSFSNGWRNQTYTRSFYRLVGEDIQSDNVFDFDETNNAIRMSGLLTLGVEPAEGHEIASTTMVLRNTDDETRIFEGFYQEETTDIRVTRLRWVERMLVVQQLRGEHPLASGERPAVLDWRYGFAQAFRLEPDRRTTRYDYEPTLDAFRLSRRDGDSNQRFHSTLDDRTHDVAADLRKPLPLSKDVDWTLSVGGMYVRKDREVDSRRLTFTNFGDFTPEYLTRDPEEIFTPDNLGPDGFRLLEVTQQTDNYSAFQDIAAGYVMAELPVRPWLDVMAGVRVEHSTQNVRTFELFNPSGATVDAVLRTTDVLPAATLTFRPLEGMAVRAGYGRTVSRPEFREMSPAVFADVVGGRQTVGNADLERATIDNVDLRWEWFPEQGDVLSVSGFYKRFTTPIESVVIPGADEQLSYDNAESADNVGVELEVRKSLGFVSPVLQDLYLAGNTAFISSRIRLGDVGGIQTNDERPLQGQSPWVVNLQLGYDDPELGFNAAILYNVFGRRIAEVGSFGLPDTYDEPFHTLDVVVGAQLPEGFDLRLTGRNLLDSTQRRTVGDELVFAVQPGWSLGLRVGWRY